MNTVEIQHLDGSVVYDLRVSAFSLEDGLLNMDLKAEPNPSGPFAHMGAPTLYIEHATVDASSLEGLVSQRLDVKTGWDTEEDEKEDNIFRIYKYGN